MRANQQTELSSTLPLNTRIKNGGVGLGGSMVALMASLVLLAGCGDSPASKEAEKPGVMVSAPSTPLDHGSDKNPDQAKRIDETRKQIEAARASASDVASTQPEEPISKWSYDSAEDKMRGKSRHVARLGSSDMIQLQFPYAGGSELGLTLRDDPEYGKDVMFVLSQGQLPCSSYDGCSFRVKFDDGPIQRFGAAGPEGGHGDVLFIAGPAGRKKFMSGLRKAKKMIVEVSVYDAGRQQFTFEPAGLNWDRF